MSPGFWITEQDLPDPKVCDTFSDPMAPPRGASNKGKSRWLPSQLAGGECRGDERCGTGTGPPHVCVPEADPVIDGRHDAALASPVGWATTTKSVTEAKKGRVAR